MLGTGTASASRQHCIDCLRQVWLLDEMGKLTKGFSKELGLLCNMTILICLLYFPFTFFKSHRNALYLLAYYYSNFSLSKKYLFPPSLSFVTRSFSVICHIFFYFSTMCFYYKNIIILLFITVFNFFMVTNI